MGGSEAFAEVSDKTLDTSSVKFSSVALSVTDCCSEEPVLPQADKKRIQATAAPSFLIFKASSPFLTHKILLFDFALIYYIILLIGNAIQLLLLC